MKGQGMFRRAADTFKRAIGRPVTVKLPDPVFNSDHEPARVVRRLRGEPKKRLRRPPCTPGTITYHDWLVRELGYDRRLADGYQYAYLNGYTVKMPGDFK